MHNTHTTDSAGLHRQTLTARANNSTRHELGEVLNFDGASINFRESVSMVPLSTFVETFAKFAQISLKKKGRGVSEGPRRERNSEKSQNTTPF
jgi:hypothetical protein